MFDIYLYIYIPGVSECMIYIYFIHLHTWGHLSIFWMKRDHKLKKSWYILFFKMYTLFNKSVPFKMFYKIYYIYTQNSQKKFNYQINVPET